jgi:preprotein translocase subunit SecD
VLDGEIISAPTTNGHFTDGSSQISGNFTATSSKALANQLKYGALPLTFELNGSSFEGPTLAGTQLKAGLYAGAAGLVLVVVYLLFYYRGLGLVAIASLIVAAAVTYGMVLLLGQGVGFTLTLPGIAGLIVAIGITADSFIVFFERLRDEVRDGKSLRLAVESGWKRARGTILAADAVSIMAALILFIFAIGVVRGFAFALGLTTLIDILVVFCFTKPLITVLARTEFFGQGHRLSGLDASHLGISGRKVTEIGRSVPTSRSAEVHISRSAAGEGEA